MLSQMEEDQFRHGQNKLASVLQLLQTLYILKIWKQSCCSLNNIDESDICSEDSYLLCYECKNQED